MLNRLSDRFEKRSTRASLSCEYRANTDAKHAESEMLRLSPICLLCLTFSTGCSEEFGTSDTPASDVRSNLAGVTWGLLAYNDQNHRLPGYDRKDERSPEGLSWRVHLLPYIDQQPLYDRFQLDEPWDSPHNSALINEMPECYRTPGVVDAGSTAMHVIVTPDGGNFGAGIFFDGGKSARLNDRMPRGSSRVLLVIVGGPDTATEWTRPTEPRLQHLEDLDSFQGLGEPPMTDGYPFAMTDGDLYFLPANHTPEDLGRLIQFHPDQIDLSRLKEFD
jgi:hypothetical protein